MDSSRFVEGLSNKHGQKLLEKIEVYCEEQDLTLSIILYEYYSKFKKAETKTDLKNILQDIKNYNTKTNLIVRDQFLTSTSKIEKEITPIEVEEGEIRCPKCKGKKTMRSQAQTRSGDEAMTQYYRCVNPEKPNCRHKWRNAG